MTDKGLAVITGAGRGIGRETALWFARDGYRLVLTYASDAGAAMSVAEECQGVGASGCWVWQLDLRDPAAIRVFAGRVAQKLGTVSVLVNNAGVIVWKPFAEQTDEEVRSQLETNLTGAMLLTRDLLPSVTGTIVNVGSDLAHFGMAGLTPYCVSKFGLRGFTQALAKERPDLRVLCVNPDRTATRMNGFEGRDPRDAAEVIWRAATGAYDVASGGDVNVWELGTTPSAPS